MLAHKFISDKLKCICKECNLFSNLFSKLIVVIWSPKFVN